MLKRDQWKQRPPERVVFLCPNRSKSLDQHLGVTAGGWMAGPVLVRVAGAVDGWPGFSSAMVRSRQAALLDDLWVDGS